MTSNRALKTDASAKARLISQIENFAIQNHIELNDLYNENDAEQLFASKLKEIEVQLATSEAAIRNINDLGTRWWILYNDIEKMQEATNIPSEWRTLTWEGVYYDAIHSAHYIEAMRRSNFKRRIWELRTFIEHCREYNTHLNRTAPE